MAGRVFASEIYQGSNHELIVSLRRLLYLSSQEEIKRMTEVPPKQSNEDSGEILDVIRRDYKPGSRID